MNTRRNVLSTITLLVFSLPLISAGIFLFAWGAWLIIPGIIIATLFAKFAHADEKGEQIEVKPEPKRLLRAA